MSVYHLSTIRNGVEVATTLTDYDLNLLKDLLEDEQPIGGLQLLQKLLHVTAKI